MIRKISHENDDFNLKIVNFDHFCKKNRLAASPLPGVTLGGEQSPAARCAGAKTRQKKRQILKNTFPGNVRFYAKKSILCIFQNFWKITVFSILSKDVIISTTCEWKICVYTSGSDFSVTF